MIADIVLTAIAVAAYISVLLIIAGPPSRRR